MGTQGNKTLVDKSSESIVKNVQRSLSAQKNATTNPNKKTEDSIHLKISNLLLTKNQKLIKTKDTKQREKLKEELLALIKEFLKVEPSPADKAKTAATATNSFGAFFKKNYPEWSVYWGELPKEPEEEEEEEPEGEPADDTKAGEAKDGEQETGGGTEETPENKEIKMPETGFNPTEYQRKKKELIELISKAIPSTEAGSFLANCGDKIAEIVAQYLIDIGLAIPGIKIAASVVRGINDAKEVMETNDARIATKIPKYQITNTSPLHVSLSESINEGLIKLEVYQGAGVARSVIDFVSTFIPLGSIASVVTLNLSAGASLAIMFLHWRDSKTIHSYHGKEADKIRMDKLVKFPAISIAILTEMKMEDIMGLNPNNVTDLESTIASKIKSLKITDSIKKEIAEKMYEVLYSQLKESAIYLGENIPYKVSLQARKTKLSELAKAYLRDEFDKTIESIDATNLASGAKDIIGLPPEEEEDSNKNQESATDLIYNSKKQQKNGK